jgi:hypothetical protein
MRIERVRALSEGIDPFGAADFYANAEVDGRSYGTGVLVGSNDVDPQFFLPYTWFFSNWRSDVPDSVPLYIEVWDDDAGLTFDDDQIDVSPVGRGVDVNYWPSTRELTGDVNAAATGTATVRGTGADSGEVRFRVEHFPTVFGGSSATCSVSGNVTTQAGGPAKGAYVFFRKTSPATSPWQKVRVTADGSFSIPSVKTGRYLFRPAGSGYYFANVPRSVNLNLGDNRVSFKAGSGPVGVRVPTVARVSLPNARIGAALRSSGASGNLVLPAATSASALASGALLTRMSPAVLGVKSNGLGYAEVSTVFAHVASVIDPQTKRGLGRAPSLRVVRSAGLKSSGEAAAVLGNASYGPGVSGARIKATLWLGNAATGYRKADEATRTTDSSGNVEFRVLAGSHVEDAEIEIEVLENPANPWCKPKLRLERALLFRPAASGDDFGTETAYSFEEGRPIIALPGARMKEELEAALFGRSKGVQIGGAAKFAASERMERARFRDLVTARGTAFSAIANRTTLASEMRRLPAERKPPR